MILPILISVFQLNSESVDKNGGLPEKEILQKQEEMKIINKAWETLQTRA